MPDATTHTHPPTPRVDEEAREARPPDVAPWVPPELGVEPPGEEPRFPDVAGEGPPAPGVEAGGADLPELASWHSLPPVAEVAPLPEAAAGAYAGAGRQGGPASVEQEASEPETDSEDTLPPRVLRSAQQRLRLPGKPTPPLDLPLPLLVLTEQAGRAPGPERPALASKLNALLAQMAAEGGDRRVADTFHRLLESGKLEGLVDPQGRTCRAAAVEALLSLGFPYALEVLPEDLEHLRTSGREGLLRLPRGPALPLAVLMAGLGTQIFKELTRSGGPDGLVTIQVGLSALAMMALWLAPPRTPVYRLGLILLALVSVVGMLLPYVAAGPAALGQGAWAGLAGLVAVFLAALRES